MSKFYLRRKSFTKNVNEALPSATGVRNTWKNDIKYGRKEETEKQRTEENKNVEAKRTYK
jgi:hypothetical protein